MNLRRSSSALSPSAFFNDGNLRIDLIAAIFCPADGSRSMLTTATVEEGRAVSGRGPAPDKNEYAAQAPAPRTATTSAATSVMIRARRPFDGAVPRISVGLSAGGLETGSYGGWLSFMRVPQQSKIWAGVAAHYLPERVLTGGSARPARNRPVLVRRTPGPLRTRGWRL